MAPLEPSRLAGVMVECAISRGPYCGADGESTGSGDNRCVGKRPKPESGISAVRVLFRATNRRQDEWGDKC
jgi:hypothetical protein